MTKISASAQERLDALSKDQADLLQLLRERQAKQTRAITRYPRVDGVALPTSWAQQRLWFIDQLEQGSAGYLIPISLRLKGTLKLQPLQDALNALLRRHEALRTVFVDADGEAKQKVRSAAHFELPLIDLCELAPAHREQAVRREKLAQFTGKFDLDAGPLIRGRLLRLADDEYALLITMHHIVADGWSLGVLVKDLSELYSAFHEGRHHALAPLPIQYADYARWQREWFQGAVLERQLDYWRAQLEGSATQLELPTDRPRPEVQSYRGANVEVAFDAELSSKLVALAQRYDMTLFMVLYAAWAILLSKLSGQDDIAIGTPVANRQRPELESLIGFFVNTLVLRVPVRDELPLDELLERVKIMTLGAYDHQDMPFEKIVEALQPERSLSRNPFFQVMLALQNAPVGTPQLRGLSVSVDGSQDEPAIVDLFISLEEKDGRIVGSVNYATDLFDRETVERWVSCFEVLARAMTDGAATMVGELPLLPDSERARVLTEFNATARDYPKDVLIHELFEQQARRTPDTVAVSYEGERLTYAQLNARANQLARHLRQQGVDADEVVAICLNRGLPMVIGLLGILKAGGAYLPLDPNYPPERLEYMLEDAAPRVVLTERDLLSLLPAGTVNVILLEEQQATLSAYVDSDMPVAQLGLRPHHLLYVIYTSGSTGRPKGTAMSHGAMVNLIEWHRETLSLEPGERVLQFAALSFDVAFQEIFSTLCTGGSLVMLNEWVRRDARALLSFLSEQGIQRLFVPPLMLQALAEQAKEQGASDLRLRDVITAGEQLRISAEIVSLFERHAQAHPGCRLHNHYGPTESHVVTALTLEGGPRQWPTLPSIGQPIANTQMYVLDRHRQPVPIGVAGEVFIGGANVAREYLRRAELTAQRFVADPFDATGRGRLYKTGDLGRWRADGILEYLGRNDDQVKIRGFRIELGEIEARLATHEYVKEAAVIAREDAATGKRLVAYVTPRDGQQPIAELLRDHLKQALPDHMVPSAFVVLEKMPTTPSGKLERRSLPAPDPASYVSRQYEAPQGEVEQTLAAIWQELLQVAQVGRHDNFFELGGHSLLATRVMARVQKTLQVDIPLRALFDMPTVHRLADRIVTLHAGQDQITHHLRQELHDLDDAAVQARIAELERELNLSA